MVLDDYNEIDDSISFDGHIDNLYDPSISQSLELHNKHLQDALHASNIEAYSYHIDKASDALHTAEYFQDCKSQALLDQQYREAQLESITAQAEIADRYQKELEEIFHPKI